MAAIVASRFAVLSVDEDEEVPIKKKTSAKKPTAAKPQNVVSTKPNVNVKKKKKPENNQNQNSKARNKQSNSAGTFKKKKEPTAEQWEEWKQKDAKMVEGSFEDDLSKAILLSKLDYEKNKNFNEAKQSENKKTGKKNRRGQKIMSLEEFNNLGSQNKESPSKPKTEKGKESPEFFYDLDQEVKNEVTEEHLSQNKIAKESNSQESLTLILYKASIEKRDREIVQLKTEIERLNTQLKNVKTRNTKLCQIIANGEMKDKAEVLMEVERLQTIKDELSSEVANLHIQLEQERSKVRQLTGEHKSKDKNKKHHSTSNDA